SRPPWSRVSNVVSRKTNSPVGSRSRQGCNGSSARVPGRGPQSPHRTKVTVEPLDDLLHHQVLRWPVTAFGHYLALVLRRHAEPLEERLLRGFRREEEVVPPVEHQRGLPDVGCEVERIHLRQRGLDLEAATDQ